MVGYYSSLHTFTHTGIFIDDVLVGKKGFKTTDVMKLKIWINPAIYIYVKSLTVTCIFNNHGNRLVVTDTPPTGTRHSAAGRPGHRR